MGAGTCVTNSISLCNPAFSTSDVGRLSSLRPI
jgi:hypothetical protein